MGVVMDLSWIEATSHEDLKGLFVKLAGKIHEVAQDITTRSATNNSRESLFDDLEKVSLAAKEHRSVQEERRRLTWFLDSIVEHAPSMMFVKNAKDLTLELWNKKCEEITTIPRQSIIGKTGFETIPKDQMEGFLERDRKVLSEKVMVEAEETITTKNGDRWLYTKKIPLFNEKGEAIYLVGISEDITERKRSEEERRQTEERCQAILDNSTSVVYAKHSDGRYILINKAYENLFHLDRKFIIGKTDHEIFPKEVADMFRRNDVAVLDARHSIESEENVPTDNGVRTYLSVKFPLLNNAGESYVLCGISTDITERKRAEEDRERLALFLNSIVDNVPTMLFVKDKDSKFLLWNKTTEELLGFSKEQMIGKTGFETFPKDQIDGFLAKDREVFSGKKLVAVEEQINTKDGEVRDIYTKKIPILDANGEPLYLVGISEDITEQKKAREEIIKAKEVAEAANRAKSEFFANVSHELRTPLTLISGPLDSLLAGEAGTLTESAKERLERMRRNAARLSSLVNDLLDFAKLEVGKMEANWQPVPAVDLSRQLYEDALLTAKARGISLSFEADEEIGYVPTDRRMLEKIVLNLLGNALKFTPSGGSVSLSLRKQGEHLEVSVKDTGIGIPEEKLPLLFQRFQQVDSSATRKYEGTGLGLALVKEFSELLGGSAGVRSTPGKGSYFWVRLPINPDRVMTEPGASLQDSIRSSEALAHLIPAAPQKFTLGISEKPRLILAEDNPDMRSYVVELLSDEFEILAVENGRLALSAAMEVAPEIIVSDVMMPEMNGFELVAEVKKSEQLRRIPVILLTARAGQEAVATGLESGADDYLAKPFSPAELRARVRAALRLYRSHQETALMLDELTQTKDLLIEIERASAAGQISQSVASSLGPHLLTIQHAIAKIGTPDTLFALNKIEALVSGLEQIAIAPVSAASKKIEVIKNEADGLTFRVRLS